MNLFLRLSSIRVWFGRDWGIEGTEDGGQKSESERQEKKLGNLGIESKNG